MFKTQEQFAATSAAALDSATTSLNTAFATSERLTALNLKAGKTFFDDFAATVRAAYSVKTPDEFVALQREAAQPFAAKSVAYCRDAHEIVAQGVEESTKTFEAKVGEFGKRFASELEKAAKSSPIGADAALAAVRSTIAAANSTYGQVSGAARQAAGIAESNMTTATDAAVKAVGESIAQTKPRKAS